MIEDYIKWTPDPDGEYNEQSCEIGKVKVTIFSDRDGEKWECQIDAGEPFELDATNQRSACREAIREAERFA